jgi:serine/threonine protein kinase
MFLDVNDDLKLGDFGIAKVCDVKLSSNSGTNYYMAPEIFKERN